MADISQLSTEELLKMRGGASATADAAPADLSQIPTEQLLKIKTGASGDSYHVKNISMGALKGASDIGTTIMTPIDKATDLVLGDRGKTIESLVTGKQAPSRSDERRASVNSFFKDNADTDSLAFKGGELAADIAGTAGVGGAISKGFKVAQYAPKLAAAIESGGFTIGAKPAATVAGAAADMGTRVAGGAITGGASAGLIDPANAGTGAVIGGALPVVAKVAGAAGKALSADVSPEVRALYQKAKDYGIDIPADRIVNSKPLNAVASSLNYVPLSGRAGTEEKMVSQLNRAVSRTVGQDSDNITQALKKAQVDLGDKFEVTLKSNKVKADDAFVTEMTEQLERAHNELGAEAAGIIGKQIDAIMAKVGPNGEIDGQAAYNIKKTLDRIGNRNSPEAYYARDLKNSLMGALNRSLGPDKAADFAKVRQQYGNMMELEPLAPNGAEGEISAARLGNLKNIRSPELQDLADIATQFIKSRESPHGAMQRVVVGGMGATAGASAPGALPVIAGTVAAGRLANTALNFEGLKNLLLARGGAGGSSLQLPSNAMPALRALVYDSANRRASP